jgi:hypothetical protein
MQGLVNFASALADGIAVMLPAFCYLAACACFFFGTWGLWTLAGGAASGTRHPRPWVPFLSIVMSGLFATFPGFLTRANVSLGTDLTASLTSYAPSTPPVAGTILGTTPFETMVNIVDAFEYFFQMFGAACVFFAILRWRAIVSGRVEGSTLGCGVQLLFGVLLVNIVTVTQGVVGFFV